MNARNVALGMALAERKHLAFAVLVCAVAALGAAGQDASVAKEFRRVDISREEMRREIAARAVREYAGPRGALRPTGRDGCVLLLDDFNDGNADGWATYDYTSGPVQAAVVNGRYVMSRAAGGDANPWQWFGASWAASNGNFATYFDGTMGLTFRITDPGTTFLAFARGFGAQFVVQSSWDGNYYLLINPGGEGMFDYAGLAYTPFNLQIGIDYRMEVGFVGPNLSMKVWRVGDPEPAAPQLQAVTSRWYDTYLNLADVGVEIDGFWQNGARGAEVDDITFCSQPAGPPPVVNPNTIPVTGIPVPRLAVLDELTRSYMAITGTKSIVQSYMVDGKVQFHRAYGWADEAGTQVLQPDAMMRLASISKPFCAAAIRQLVADHKVKMSDHAFNLGQHGGGILNIQPFPSLGDPRYADITLQHLVEHSSGWDRGAYGDIFWCDFHAASVLGVPMPISRWDRLRFLLSTPLQYNPGDPGVVDSYSNTAYDVLGLIIEQVSGMAFEDYIRAKVLPKIRVAESETEIGRTFPQNFDPREPFYDPVTLAPNVYDTQGPWVRLPYGGWNVESYAAVASRIASNVALMGLASRRWLFGENAGKELPQRLPRDFFDLHNGALPGTDTVLVHARVGDRDVINAYISNHSASGAYFFSATPIHPSYVFYFNHIAAGLVDWPTRRTGDMNCDGHVTSADMAPFFLAVQDINAYAAAYPNCTGFNGDTNGDLKVDVNDVAGFLNCVGHGPCP